MAYHRVMFRSRDTKPSFIAGEVQRIRESGALGRSPVYARLLQYLADTTLSGKVPREIDIAVDVFERRDFDSTADSSVRVYLHNLRQRLDAWYAGQGAGQSARIRIPKGEYRLQVDSTAPKAPAAVPGKRNRANVHAAVLVVLAAAIGYMAATALEPGRGHRDIADTALWRPISHGSQPLIVAVGDYYVFGELGRAGSVQRLIRDFDVNSRQDLVARYGELAGGARYADVHLSYLPLGVGAALADVLAVVRAAGREVVILPTSQLDVKTVQSSDILYIGYLSGLRLLQDFVFASSSFEPGATFDELVSRDGGQLYVSEAGLPDAESPHYVDYGFLSTFAGPNGNHLMILSGMRDEALMQMASTLTSKTAIDRLMKAVPDAGAPLSLEALYRVRGIDRTNIAAALVFAASVDHEDIWMERETTAFRPAASGAE